MRNTLLSSTLSIRQFLARHWQKQALLIRAAIPGFEGFLSRSDVFSLAADPDVESRLILRDGQRWEVQFGPFARSALKRLPQRNWTLLIQGVNLHRVAGAKLLSEFNFIPHARLDDLMVSYAVPGGGVGPHFDAYDVFLLQGFGRRRWQVSQQRDLALKPNVPIKILRRFEPAHQWDLDAGDMLYLPPHYAHSGVALETCTTYSIGFRSPDWHALGARFFEDIAERQALRGRYADPHLRAAKHPGLLPMDMVHETRDALSKVRWSAQDISDFLGRYLTEPKQTVFFEPPAQPLTLAKFEQTFRRNGACLALKSLLLYSRTAAFMNGESVRFPRGVPEPLRTLADFRALKPTALSAPQLRLLKDWHDSGFLHLG